MNKKKYESLVICRDKYNSNEEFENEVKKAVMLLLNAGYIMTVRYDEPAFGIICIDYNYANQEYGYSYPYWLESEEADALEFMLMEKNDDE